MQLIQKTIEYQKVGEEFKLYYIADIHLGNAACDKNKYSQHVNRISSENHSYWVGGGDYCDCIHTSDKRFDITTIDPRYHDKLDDLATYQQIDFQNITEPIKDKCLGLLRGNHEEKIRLHYHRDICRRMCEDWNVPYLKDTTMIRLRFIRKSKGMTTKPSSTVFTIFCSHSHIAGRRAGGKTNRLEDLMRMFDADIYFIAHGHQKVVVSSSSLSVPTSGELKLVNHRKIGMMTGSYLRAYQQDVSCYAEKGLYCPSDLGATCVTIKPYNREITAEV